jgi:hypothetical protein
MNAGIAIVLSFCMIGLGLLTAVLWSVGFPITRCQKTRISEDSRYNICIRNKTHEGSHMSADGCKF